MPSAVSDQIPSHEIHGTKRRWEDHLEHDIQRKLSSMHNPHGVTTQHSQTLFQNLEPQDTHLKFMTGNLLANRQILSLPYWKQHGFFENDTKRPRLGSSVSSSQYFQAHARNPSLSQKITDSEYCQGQGIESQLGSQTKLGNEQSKAGGEKLDTTPCHTCHRKPTSRSEILQYVTCEGCKERACGVCMRECRIGGEAGVLERLKFRDGHGPEQKQQVTNRKLEWNGEWMAREYEEYFRGSDRQPLHRRRVCSDCCVEVGSEGEVWCLGCLAMHDEVG